MLEKAIWDKLPECIFESFEIAKNYEGDLPLKSPEPDM